jgi:hypothetical protein
MAFDANEHGLAQRYFFTGLRADHDAGYTAMAAHILADLSFQAATRGHRSDGVILGGAARRQAARSSSGVQASVSSRLAFAYGRTGICLRKDVRADAGGGEQRIVRLGLVFADDPCDAAAAEPGPVLSVEHRVAVVAGLVEPVFFQVGGQQRDGAAVQGDVAGLAALAGQRRDGRALKADVPDGEAGEFGDPGSWSASTWRTS